jgi:DNA-binding transcriptional regulator GbsR (MarR family)
MFLQMDAALRDRDHAGHRRLIGCRKSKVLPCLSMFSVSSEKMSDELPAWEKAREEFVAQWGSLGTQWGINRTMAMIHALLMTSPEPMCTDEVMEKLQISRGNAHTNLKDLVGWNLVRIITKKGDRKEYFEAEKDVWKIFITISKERKRREIEPAIRLLRDCAAQTKDETTGPGRDFHQQMKDLDEFLSFGVKVGDTVISMKHASALQWAMRLLG